MKLLSIIFMIFAPVLANAQSDEINCKPCPQSERKIYVTITNLNQTADYAVFTENDVALQSIDVYPQLPDDPNDKYIAYRGHAGTLVTLKISADLNGSPDKCNATLEAPFIGDDKVEPLFCQANP